MSIWCIIPICALGAICAALIIVASRLSSMRSRSEEQYRPYLEWFIAGRNPIPDLETFHEAWDLYNERRYGKHA